MSVIEDSAPKRARSARERAGSLIKRVPTAVFGGVAVLTTVLALWAGAAAYQLCTDGPSANHALTDVAGTEAVINTVTETVETVFSYEYRDTARTREAARELLVGAAVEQYDVLFAQVEVQAPERRTVLSTAVRSVGVMELRDDRATVLVFVDQQVLHGDGTHTSGASQLEISAVHGGGSWRIDGITVL